MSTIIITLGLFLLAGTGCVSQTSIDEKIARISAEQLGLSQGAIIELDQTIFGIAVDQLEWIVTGVQTRTVSIERWVQGQSVALRWFTVKRKESQTSIDTQAVYDAQYGTLAIGEKAPPRPKKEYEEVTTAGSISSERLDDATELLVPYFWQEGEEQRTDTSLIWITPSQYDELVNTRSTDLNLGLFDDDLSSTLAIRDQITGLLNWIKQKTVETASQKDLLRVQSRKSWGNYSLMVDGVATTVRTIEAGNTFGHYTILANRDNPVILKLSLNPISFGSINPFSMNALTQGFVGYRITSIDLQSAP